MSLCFLPDSHIIECACLAANRLIAMGLIVLVQLATVFCSVPFLLWLVGTIVLSTALIMLAIVVILFGLVPIIFKYSYALQRSMVFLNFVKWPRNPEYNNPAKYGLNNTRNFYLNTDQDVKIGVWHSLPNSLSGQSKYEEEESYNLALDNGEPVILYMHGNSGSRVNGHRIELYKLLQGLNFHVIAFDYRSYGDSSPIDPSEAGVVDDAIFMFKWLRKLVTKAPIFVWGHSLGTGVSTHALANLAVENIQTRGLILEAPFNNLRDEITEHPFAKIFNFLPWFEFFVVDPMAANMLRFETDKHLAQFQAPVLILHAKDDKVIPFDLGKKLYDTVRKLRNDYGKNMEFVSFESNLKFGHKFICRSPRLPSIIETFVNKQIK